MNRKYKKITIALFLLISLSSFSYPEDFLENFKGTWGVGTSILDSNYANTETEVTLAPYIFGSFGDLQIEANRLHYPLDKTSRYSLLATANYRTQQYSETLNKDRSIELGFTLDVPLTNGFSSRLTALKDISNTHDGHELEVQVYRHDSLGKLSILTALAIQYQNKNLADYYYGDTNYNADAGYVYEIEVIATYPINNFAIFTGIRSYWYGSNVENSPLSNSNNTLLSFAGVGYRF